MFSQNIGQIFKQYRERIAMLQDIDEEQALAKALEDIKAEWKIWLGIWGSHEEDIHTSTKKIQSELDTLPEIKEEYADNVNKLHNMQACIKLSTSSGTYYESAQHTVLMDEIISTLIALHNDARRYGYQHANREFKEKFQILQEKYFSYFKEREQCRLFKAIVDNTVELLENLKNTPPISERAKQLIDNRIKYLSLCLYTFSPQGEFDNEKFQEEYYNETRSIIVELEHQDSVITQVKSALDNPLCPPTVKESTLKTP
ncbi:hypothetical protein [Legionella sp. CNM-4043-24]|uniref:hypothetical protein n=1 Tax=Legionella sp. CNM-4043-24 TaxID=3421646 RepID=UPI00403B1561